MTGSSVLWRRLDAPGHDGCRLEDNDGGWRLEGTAVFLEAAAATRLNYEVAGNHAWHTQRGQVRGWLGNRPVAFSIARTTRGGWTLNGVVLTGLEQCIDLDLGFTPATNLIQLRRLALRVGQEADVPVAWLDPSAGTLDVLHQRYARKTENTYWYEAPRFEYAAMLEVTSEGFMSRYPGLWEIVE